MNRIRDFLARVGLGHRRPHNKLYAVLEQLLTQMEEVNSSRGTAVVTYEDATGEENEVSLTVAVGRVAVYETQQALDD